MQMCLATCVTVHKFLIRVENPGVWCQPHSGLGVLQWTVKCPLTVNSYLTLPQSRRSSFQMRAGSVLSLGKILASGNHFLPRAHNLSKETQSDFSSLIFLPTPAQLSCKTKSPLSPKSPLYNPTYFQGLLSHMAVSSCATKSYQLLEIWGWWWLLRWERQWSHLSATFS
jgi:hypothetical protein